MLVRKHELGASKTVKPSSGEHRITAPKVKVKAEEAILKSMSLSPKLTKVFNKLNPRFRKTLLSTLIAEPDRSGGGEVVRKSSMNIKVASITRELGRAKKVRRVGILDLGAWIGGLPLLLKRLNAAQSPFVMFEIQAPLPGGMLKTPEGMLNWAAVQLGEPLSKAERNQMEPQMVANEFFAAAEDIRKSMGLDLIVGMTPAMVAGVDHDGGIYWNHFSSLSGKTILLSTADLRHFAEKAGRSFEAAVGAILLASLLVAVNSKLEYHDDTGCLFDYNGSRVSLIKTLKEMQIEKSCLAVMTAEQRTAAHAMLKVLKALRRRSK